MIEAMLLTATAWPLLLATVLLLWVAWQISRKQHRFALADGDIPIDPRETKIMTIAVWWIKPYIGKPIHLIFGQEKVGVGWPTLEFEAADEIAEKIKVNHMYRMRVAESPAKRIIIEVIEEIGEVL